ncbi:anti-sigma factor [Nevskia sp.]|uniref:anti-sigma factor n=1 Tax=Nevskia sp. TaxID=1929292 RepID=UPI0025E34F60|nr:anti-sigma factor [Nevskia sp.]
MNYEHPELIDKLAAHYVIGALRGPARLRFERLLASSGRARQQVGLWEMRFAPVALGLPPVAPPPDLRAALLAETRQPLRLTPPLPPIRPSRRAVYVRRLRFLAAACACGLVIVGGLIKMVGARLSFPAGSPAEVTELAQLAGIAEPQLSGDELRPLPIMLAKLGMPGSSMGWMISLTPDHRQLAITASDDVLNVGRSSVQLWWLGDNGIPQPLAILGTERDSTVVVDVPAGLNEGRALVFAISLEPPGGSPTGQPTRPVLGRAGDDPSAI